MGRKSLLTPFTGFFIGMGTTSATFQDGGRQPTLKEQLSTVNPRLSAAALVNFTEILVRRLFEVRRLFGVRRLFRVRRLFKTSASQRITLRE